MVSEIFKPESGLFSRRRGPRSNTTLTSLNLNGDACFFRMNCGKDKASIISGNQIGEEGTRVLSELLKTNVSLKRLDLSCDKKDV